MLRGGADQETQAVGGYFVGVEDEVVDRECEERARGAGFDGVRPELDAHGH